MGRDLTKDELDHHRDNALNNLNEYITSLINSSDGKIRSKADKLSYWVEDWVTFLQFESNFSPSSLRRYKRGEIVKAHLGYNVGSEEGGLHYCIVIDKNNSKNSPVVTVVPLTSIKESTDLSHLHKGNINLGNELFRNLNSKITLLNKRLSDELNELDSMLNASGSDSDAISSKIHTVLKERGLLQRTRTEVSKMRRGSIALVNQIRTISKIRIYDPKTNFDVLSNVKLSNEKLDLIDAEILQNFTGQK